ncbi:MAG: right-handed parallel beta-helix repeat-containing protein, partial [Phycisphaerales bacterium]
DAPAGFVNGAARDLRLASGSPCVDSGSNAFVGSNFADAAGNRRVFDGDGNLTATVDMGAYERDATPYTPRLYVRAGAGPGGQGGTWATAYSSLQSALSFAAETYAGVTEIWVGEGTYKPAGPGGSRDARFTLLNNCAVHGGFAGTEVFLSERNPAAHVSTLSGDLNGDDFGELNLSDNSRTIVSAPVNPNRTCVISGFTLTAANNTIGSGGALVAGGSTGITVRDCVFRGNRAFSGAAMALTSIQIPGALIERCTFEANVVIAAGNGGCGGAQVNAGRATFTDCVFRENLGLPRVSGAPSGGGAIVFNGAEATFERCTFVRNTGERGSGVAVSGLSTGTFLHCQFLGNVNSAAGALWCGDQTRLTVVGSLFAANRAGTGSGAIVSTNAGSTVSMQSFALVTNCTISGNHSNGTAGTPGAAAVTLGNENGHFSTFSNTIIFGNTSTNASGLGAQVAASGAAPTLNYTTVEGHDGIFGGGTGNSAVSPMFLRAVSAGNDMVFGTNDDDYGDLRLGAGSAAIDSGNSNALPADTTDADRDGNTGELLPVDLLGLQRLVDDPATVNTGPGGGPHVDRGVYEVQVNCVACPGVREWRNPAGGAFDAVANWFPSVPNATHDTLYNLSGAYTVTLSAPAGTTVSNRSARIESGDVTLNPGAATLALSTLSEPSLVVAGGAGSDAALTITGGRVTAGSVTIARGDGSTGELNVTGPSARLVVAPLDLYVGFGGAGTMNITGGAQVTSRIAAVATLPGSSGSVLVDGPGSRWSIPFYLTVDNGTVTVRNGATLQAGFGIFLLQNAVLSGDGTILGDVVNFGEIEPGNSPGTLTITGSYTQVGEIPDLGSSSGTLTMEVGGTNPGQFDRLIVQGPVQLGGGLVVKTVAGAFPQPPEGGLSLPIIDALGGIATSETTGLPADRFDVAFFPRVPGAGGGASDKFLKLERPEGGGAAFFNLTTGSLGAPITINGPANTSASSTPSAVVPADLDGD